MQDVRYTRLPTRLCELLVTDHGRGVSGLYFPDHRRGPEVAPSWLEDPEPFRALAAELDTYLRGEPVSFEVPLDLRGTAFQLEVWSELQRIPTGTTVSYGELAAAVGRPSAARAVAAAVARNPVSIVVPCHRVVGANGTLTGYAGGIERKRALLTMERALSKA
jgi:methylated-DNA-[protein]-cysteine S-methyltransferase